MKAAAVADRIAAAMAGGSAPAGKKSCGAADAFGWMGGLEGKARTPPPDRRMSRIAPNPSFGPGHLRRWSRNRAAQKAAPLRWAAAFLFPASTGVCNGS